MEEIKSQELYYLNKPLLSDSVEMLKYTLMGLDLDGHIDIFLKNIYINKNARYKRPRMYVRLGINYQSSNNYTSSELFIISKIDKPEVRLYELRNNLALGLDKKIEKFKKEYVLNDLTKKGLLLTSWFLSSFARSKKREYKKLIQELDNDIDTLLKNRTMLDEKIKQLGSNLIFVEDTTLKKLGKKILDLDELNRYFHPSESYISYGGYYGGFGSFGAGGGGGGFSGFGGGSFGGGGSGGSW